MKKHLKKLGKILLVLLSLPVLYMLISLLLTAITVNKNPDSIQPTDHTIFLNTNGVHLDIILPKSTIDSTLLEGLHHNPFEKYLAFGWGDENFYLNTPTWGDLTFKNAFSAMFLKSSSLVHLTRYKTQRTGWIAIKVTPAQLKTLNEYLLKTFALDENGNKQILFDKGYTPRDDFYKAHGSYSCFKTCNSWANNAFKTSGLKACLWTPFDFGLMGKYE